jgi:hypothetical protein
LKLATADAKQAATSLSALYACCTIVCCVILHVPVCKLLILWADDRGSFAGLALVVGGMKLEALKLEV